MVRRGRGWGQRVGAERDEGGRVREGGRSEALTSVTVGRLQVDREAKNACDVREVGKVKKNSNGGDGNGTWEEGNERIRAVLTLLFWRDVDCRFIRFHVGEIPDFPYTKTDDRKVETHLAP